MGGCGGGGGCFMLFVGTTANESDENPAKAKGVDHPAPRHHLLQDRTLQ